MRLVLFIKLKLNKVLPHIIKAIRRKSNTVMAYKENGKWYIKDLNGYSKEANELVDGIPQLIEHFVGQEARTVTITYSDMEFEDSKVLNLVSTDEFGSWYEHIDERNVPHAGWLCPVFLWYFPRPPEELYVIVKSMKKTKMSLERVSAK